MTGNKLALRLRHSLMDRPKTNAFAQVTSTRSPRQPFRRIYIYVASLLGICAKFLRSHENHIHVTQIF